jgi:hypothetical protein
LKNSDVKFSDGIRDSLLKKAILSGLIEKKSLPIPFLDFNTNRISYLLGWYNSIIFAGIIFFFVSNTTEAIAILSNFML